MFCGLVIFIKNFDPINIRRPCAHKITMFCSEVMMIKSFNPIKSRRPWPPISISHLFQQGPFSSWPLLFLHLGCFCLDIIYSNLLALEIYFKITDLFEIKAVVLFPNPTLTLVAITSKAIIKKSNISCIHGYIWRNLCCWQLFMLIR